MIIAGFLLILASLLATWALSRDQGRQEGYDEGFRDGMERVYDRCAGKWGVTRDAARRAIRECGDPNGSQISVDCPECQGKGAYPIVDWHGNDGRAACKFCFGTGITKRIKTWTSN